MGLSSTLGSLLFFLSLYGICTGFEQENCTNYKPQSWLQKVFSVPGDVAMLNSTLIGPDVFNFPTVPYNITWYNSRTGEEMSDQTGQIMVHGETLWFLNVTLDDAGEYVSIVRTPSWCYMQAMELGVNLWFAEECCRPQKVSQTITKGSSATLSCPLKNYINKLDSYNITSTLQWYKGCDPIEDDDTTKYTYKDKTSLAIDKVEPQDSGFYTCTLTFTLSSIMGSVSETINAKVTGWSLVAQVHEPGKYEIIRVRKGSKFSKMCRVFFEGAEMRMVNVVWSSKKRFIKTINPSDRIYTSNKTSKRQEVPVQGMLIERTLMFSELREEDFYINYTCEAISTRGISSGGFKLIPQDPDVTLPIGLVFGGVMVLFVISVTVYNIFKIDIVLGFRKAFPVFYTNKDMDGKLYDAYVAYPQPYSSGFSKEVETFALNTLPEMLENACGYKLFIAGRDCLPGQAIVDSVEENIKASRCLLLLYTASTFRKRHISSMKSNINNISKSIDISDKSETSDSSSTSFDGSDKGNPETRQQLECVAAMHRMLLEGSLKVVLVELEEITPAQLALFPESLRHLRKKQGAVCWWKNQRTKQSWRTRRSKEDEEKGGKDSQLSPSLSLSSRFWKEMRYHMPVSGRRVIYPERTAFLS